MKIIGIHEETSYEKKQIHEVFKETSPDEFVTYFKKIVH